MGFTGSDILEVTYNSPSIGSGTFFCKGGESVNMDLGGLISTDDQGMATGNGDIIDQMTMNRSKFELGPIAWDLTDKNELAQLAALAAAPVGATFTVSYVTGSIWEMQKGKPVGNLVGDGYAGTIPVTLQGAPNASRIS